MLEYFERTEGSRHFFKPLAFTPSIGKFLYLFHVLPTKTCSTFVKFMHKRLVSLCLFSMIIKEQQTEVINIKCYHENLHACKGNRRVHFFTLLAGAPSLGKFTYSINVLPTKRCSFSVTLVSPCLHLFDFNVYHVFKAIDQPDHVTRFLPYQNFLIYVTVARQQRGPVEIASGPAPAVLRLGRTWLSASSGGGIALFLP